jgi:transcriptional activator SPT7
MYQLPPPSKQPEFDEHLWNSQLEEEQFVPTDRLIITPEVGRYAMEQAIARMLFHTGFEGHSLCSMLILDFQASAFDLVTGVAIEYLQKIGATLTLYMTCTDTRSKFAEEVRPSTTFLTQELLLHALDMNGVEDLEKLDVYIKDDIERYGTKLEDCHRRLKRFLSELLVLRLRT